MSGCRRAIRRYDAGEIADNGRALQIARDDVFNDVGSQVAERANSVRFNAVVSVGL